jgi:uncharacterized transporter YbjL
MKKLFVTLLLLLPLICMAQGNDAADQFGNFLRESGKLYVVFAVIITIFAGIIIMLIRQEMKLNRLEKKLTNKN